MSTPFLLALPGPDVAPSTSSVAIGWSPNSRYLAVGNGTISGQPRLLVYDWVSGSAVRMPPLPDYPEDSATVNRLAWSADGRYLALAVSNDPRCVIYDFIGGSPVRVPFTGLSGDVTGGSVGWSPDDQYLVCGVGSAPYLRFFSHDRNTSTFTEVEIEAGDEPEGRVSGIGWAPDGSYCGAAFWFAQPHIAFYYLNVSGRFSRLTGVPGITINGSSGSFYVNACSWSPDSRYAAVPASHNSFSGTDAHRLTVYDFSVVPPVKVESSLFTAYGGFSNTATWSHDNRYLIVGAAWSPRPKVFDWESGIPVQVLPADVFDVVTNVHSLGVAWSPKGDMIATSNASDSPTWLRFYSYTGYQELGSYDIEWRVQGETELAGSIRLPELEDTCHQVTGLNDYTVYEARVREYDSITGIDGAWSAWVQVQTLPPPPPEVSHYWPFSVNYNDAIGNAVTQPMGVTPPTLQPRNNWNEVIFEASKPDAYLAITGGAEYAGDWLVGCFVRLVSTEVSGWPPIFYFVDDNYTKGLGAYFGGSGGSFYLYVEAMNASGWNEALYASTIPQDVDYLLLISSVTTDGPPRIDAQLIGPSGVVASNSVLTTTPIPLPVGTEGKCAIGSPYEDGTGTAVGEVFIIQEPNLHQYYIDTMYNSGDGNTLLTTFGIRLYAAFAQEFNAAFGSYPATADERVFSIVSGIEAAFSAAYSIARAAAAEQVLPFPDNLARAATQELSASGTTVPTGQRHVAVLPPQQGVGAAFSARYVDSAEVLQSISFSQTDNLLRGRSQSFQFNALIEFPVSRRHLYSIPSQILVPSVYVAGLNVPRTPVAAAISLLYNSSILIGGIHSIPVVSSGPVAASYMGTTDAAEKDFVAARHRTVYSLENRATVVEYLVSEDPNE